ncbi:MAG: GNAT family protein [Pseudomonadota bacterium]
MRLSDGPTTLRRLSPDDLHAFLAYRRDPNIARYQSWAPMTTNQAAGFLASAANVDPLLQRGSWTQIGVEAGHQLIGDMGLFLSQDGREAEMGITLEAKSQGQGHAERAARLAISYLFSETEIERIVVGADTRNAPSLALIHRLPFVQTGTVEADGVEEIEFVLHRSEFLAS